MQPTSPYEESFNKLICTIRNADDISCFKYMVHTPTHIAIIDITHVCLETAVRVITAALNRVSVTCTAMMFQIYQIVKEIHDSHRIQDNGFIKAVNSDLVSAALITAPYRDDGLDVRIAIADSPENIQAAKDFIFYELGLNSLKNMHPTTLGEPTCLT